MDENRPPYKLHAPGAAVSAPSYALPAYRDVSRPRRHPHVDEHEIRPEVERREMIDGEILQTFPAEFEHAVQNGDLDYLLRAHLAKGYRVATDLATRHDRKADFASDSAVVRDGIDPSTGSRYREELAFEVVSEQPKARATRKAPTMLKRGVKRVFAVFVKTGVVSEWEPDERLKEKGRWVNLAADAKISHPSLAEPMPVGAILDAASADDTVARALDAKGNPVVVEIKTKSHARGFEEGRGEGREVTLRSNVKDLCGVLAITWSAPRDGAVRGMSLSALETLWKYLVSHKKWPEEEAAEPTNSGDAGVV